MCRGTVPLYVYFPCSAAGPGAGGVGGGLAGRVGFVPVRITPDQKRIFAARMRDGWSIKECADAAGVSYAWGKAYHAGLRNSAGATWREVREGLVERSGPRRLGDLSGEARRALENIAFFAERYFGAPVMPWQLEATDLIVRLLDTPEDEFVVINCPPGSGKSTFFTKIVPAWLTARRRHIRGMIGSASMTMAQQYVGELRDILGSPVPLSQPPEAIRRGYAVDPVGCLAEDFGKFKHDDKRWAREAFFVAQVDDRHFSAKEPTWQAFGRGSTFIGSRVDFCIWDDLYDPEQMRSSDARQQLRDWWVRVAESRLEPGGLLVLQGQRLDPEDIYRFALDSKKFVFDAEGEPVGDPVPKYHHVKFKAHYDELCRGAETHRLSSPPYPVGCLLFPKRLPWSKLAAIRENSPEEFETVYQQEDSAPGGVLVDRLWVRGGRGEDGAEFPGCWDLDRGGCELPEGVSPPVVSVVSIDPSPTRFWAWEWWCYLPDVDLRFLMDLRREKMTVDDCLKFDVVAGRFSGLMEDWQARSVELGWPVSHWIFEQNAAARFFSSADHVKRWASSRSTLIVPHDTNRNKSDPRLGVPSIAQHWKFGRVRLPGRPNDPGRLAALRLVDEVTRYRLDGRSTHTDDCVMAQWFFEWNLPNLVVSGVRNPQLWRPSWLRAAPGGPAR